MSNMGTTILLVEDEAIIALLHRKILDKHGYNVVAADTGEKAVRIIELNHDIDLVLMDINLGDGIDGTEAAEEILKIRQIPLVFLSSHTEPEVVDKTEGITSYGYIVKNSGETVLMASIKMAFRLFEANEKLRLQAAVLDQIDDRVTVTDMSGNITYVNKAEIQALGYSREELIGSSVEKFGDNPDAGATQSEILEATLNTGHWRGEVVNYTAEGEELVMDCRTRMIYDYRGNPFALCGVSSDITEKKRAEEEIRKSEAKYRLLVQSTNSIILRWKRDGEILFINDFGLFFFGFEKDELIGKNVADTIIPAQDDSGYNLPERIERLFDDRDLYIHNIDRNITKDGRIVWISWTNNVITDDQGRPVEMYSVGQDITDQKEAEDRAGKYRMELEKANEKLEKTAVELKESEEKFRNLAESIPVAVMMYQDDKWIYANPAAERISGYSLSELVNMNFWDFTAPEYAEKVKANGRQREKHGIADQQYEFRIIAKNGTEKWVHLYGTSVIYRGKRAGLVSVIDITESRKTRKELMLSEQKYKRIFENIQDVYYYTNMEGILLEISPSIESCSGYTRDELIGKPVEQAYNRSEERALFLKELMRRGQVSDYELELKSKNGDVIVTAATSHVVMNSEGEPEGVEGSLRNISRRKYLEDQLRRSEEKYRSIVEDTPVLICRFKPGYIIEFVNDEYCRYFGKNCEELEGTPFLDLIHEEDRATVMEAIESLSPGNPVHVYEHRVVTSEGEVKWQRWADRALFNDKGEIETYQSIGEDITERKLAEEQLILERERLDGIIKGTNAGTWEWNVQTGELAINERWAEIIGYSIDELEPVSIETWRAFSHPDDLEKSNKLLQRHFSSENDFYELELRMKHKKGHWVWVLDRGRVAKWLPDGKPLMMMGTHQDISLRKESEHKIESLLLEKELLLKETHHRIKNNMNTVYGLLYMQADEVQDHVSRNVIMEAASRVQSMMLLYDRLYRSIEVHELSINDYLPVLIDEIVKVFNSRVPVKTDIRIDDIILKSNSISALGIIINELITNSMKYAFNNTSEGLIFLSISENDKMVNLVYGDNGPGFPESFSFDSSAGFGMELVDMMVKQLGGSIDIIKEKAGKVIINFRI